jgi:tRNA (guanine9-N1)-methyltransferase
MMREQEEPEKASPLLAAAPEESSVSNVLSKTKRKKLLKQQRRLEIRKERKLKEKAANRARAEAQGRDLEAERQFLQERTATGERKRRLQLQWDKEKLPLAQKSFQICLDCSYEELMTEKEIASLAFQIRYCYSYNKKSPNPCLWAATSLSGRTLDLLEKETGYSEWVNRCYTGTPQSLEEYYKDNLQNAVYLTSDSDNTIEHLDNDKIYVIGGIVDRNRLKGIAMRRAEELGIATAKLPLTEHLEKMAATRVLTCNHVFDILLKCREHDGDWSKALQQVLPSRKDAEFKALSKSKQVMDL